MQRLTHSQVKPTRDNQLVAQRGKCALCRLPITARELPALDHDHGTGALRETLHHSCNALLGKIENNAPRFGLGDPSKLAAFLAGVGPYLAKHRVPQTPWLHPTHLTEEEKRVKKNKKAREARITARKAKP